MTIDFEYERQLTFLRAIEERHSIRKYKKEPISQIHIDLLNNLISLFNEESGLNMQLILNEPKAFTALLAKVMHFENAVNYIALVGKESDEKLEEKCGYYGEKLVLEAQLMGLNTCWVGGTYKKMPEVIKIGEGEKLVLIIAIGYGNEPGKVHKSKSPESFFRFEKNPEVFTGLMAEKYELAPDWLKAGIKAAALAPTAVNQQKFRFVFDGRNVHGETAGGAYTKVDLGIAECHFEIASGKKIL